MRDEFSCFQTGDVLYLAVRDVLVEGKRLEGRGVTPDITVERSIRIDNKDLQLLKTVEEVTRRIK